MPSNNFYYKIINFTSKINLKFNLNLILLISVFSSLVMSSENIKNHVVSQKKIKLMSLKDLNLELNEFQTDCLKLLSTPLIKAAQIELLEIDSEHRSLRVSGKSVEGTKVQFGLDKWIFLPFEGNAFEFQPTWKDKPIFVDNDGYFQFTIQIPDLKNLTISLQFVDKARQYYNLEIEFSKDHKIQDVVLRPFFVEEQKKQFCTKSRITFDLGATLFSYKQSLDSIKGQLEYSSLNLPAYAISVDWAQNPESDQSFSYQNAPGLLSARGAFNVDANYQWQILDYHYSYGRTAWIQKIRESLIYTRLKTGLQYHNVPLSEATLATKIMINPIQIANALVGVNMKMYSDKHWMFEFQFDVQYPLFKSIDLDYKLMCDGSAGAFFSYGNNYLFGFKLSGHLHQFNYDRGSNYFDRYGNIQFMQSSAQLSLGHFF